MALGNVIRQRRLALGWTLEELAERARLTPNYVGTLERNPSRDPSVSTVIALARAFRVAPGELLGGVRDLGPEATEAARLFEASPPDVQDAVLRLLRATARRRR
ncbi:MAG: helix-turn-helix transcriptional regulator [Labilithrix sp.]|nr:helix-turn-helix transcriptional regulator [Labilithrix sp.]